MLTTIIAVVVVLGGLIFFHVGSLYQNAGLFCASAGLGGYVHASGLHALDGKLSLPEGWRVFIVQTVGVLK